MKSCTLAQSPALTAQRIQNNTWKKNKFEEQIDSKSFRQRQYEETASVKPMPIHRYNDQCKWDQRKKTQ